jgi:hypothetical protein
MRPKELRVLVVRSCDPSKAYSDVECRTERVCLTYVNESHTNATARIRGGSYDHRDTHIIYMRLCARRIDSYIYIY